MQRLFGERCPPVSVLNRELSCPDVYLWLGLHTDDGELVGTHRAMRFGDSLLLKGVSVAGRYRGSSAAPRLALAIKRFAFDLGYARIAAWIEPSGPERFLAARLGVKASGPFVHRFMLPVPANPVNALPQDMSGFCGSLPLSAYREPMVPDLLQGPVGAVSWVLDGQRIVLSGNPCTSVSELPSLLSALLPIAGRLSANSVEVPVPAADLLAAFSIITAGVVRLSRARIRMGTGLCAPMIPTLLREAYVPQ